MDRICDLHTHSCYSDGTLTPAQILKEADALGLSAVALCDHNTVEGLPDFLSAAQNHRVEAVPGAEFSTDYEGTELHILGLFIRPAYYEDISHRMEEMHRLKEQSNITLVDNLRRAGYDISYDRIREKALGQINRAHIAAELTALGYTANRKEAFSTLLKPGLGFYEPPRRIDAFEMIGYLRSIGAVPVWAHPFLSLKEEAAVRRFLGPAKEAGLRGMEILYPLHDAEQTRQATALAVTFDLLPSGGSDFHGDNKPDIRLGSGKGTLKVPLSFLHGLKKAAGLVSAP
jgi:predicted metal-dependent phosphoesterase TrpH